VVHRPRFILPGCRPTPVAARRDTGRQVITDLSPFFIKPDGRVLLVLMGWPNDQRPDFGMRWELGAELAGLAIRPAEEAK